MDAVLSAISVVGFPIVITLLFGFFIYKIWQQQTTANKEREERLFAQMDKFSAALESFSNTLGIIDARLAVIETEVLDNPDQRE